MVFLCARLAGGAGFVWKRGGFGRYILGWGAYCFLDLELFFILIIFALADKLRILLVGVC